MITQKRLKELLDYDKYTGIFTWKIQKSNNVKVGKRAGYKLKNGYEKVSVDDKIYALHRLVWLYVTGKFPDNQIDHINRIKDDNRIENLRDATISENQRNCNIQNNNASGYTGVYFDKCNKNWKSIIWIDKKSINLGNFKIKTDAIKARKEAEELYNYYL